MYTHSLDTWHISLFIEASVLLGWTPRLGGLAADTYFLMVLSGGGGHLTVPYDVGMGAVLHGQEEQLPPNPLFHVSVFPSQLQVHMALQLCPILGDHTYAARVGSVLGQRFLWPAETTKPQRQVGPLPHMPPLCGLERLCLQIPCTFGPGSSWLALWSHLWSCGCCVA